MVLILLVIVFVLPAEVLGEVFVPSVISDNMVIQRGGKVPIWGNADGGEKVTVKGSWQLFGKSTRADENGKWLVKIDAPKAGGPYEITIKGKNKITVRNVLAGEVWVCSGQSNMQMSLVESADGEKAAAAANFPEMRFFTVEHRVFPYPAEDCVGKWELCTPATARRFSAVAYYFGREFNRELNVPVGLIHTSWGGTLAESWTSMKTLESDPRFKPALDEYEQLVAAYPQAMKDYQKALTQWQVAAADANAKGDKPPRRPTEPYGPGFVNTPSGLYNAMLAPLMPHRIAGVIWYQGERNARQELTEVYLPLFTAMIGNWRQDWGQGDVPFYYVQIAPYKYRPEPVAAEIRDAQRLALAVPNTGMAVTLDIGNPDDIHPTNKIDVGKRLALWALAKNYGRKGIVYSGPLYKSMKIEDGAIRLFFDHVGGGLIARGGELTDFTIAGQDRNFVAAKAQIDPADNSIVVSSDAVKAPAAVRFGWTNAATPNLFNKQGLPASSFRTDDWPRAKN
jgi:sialate O-acetylesterase